MADRIHERGGMQVPTALKVPSGWWETRYWLLYCSSRRTSTSSNKAPKRCFSYGCLIWLRARERVQWGRPFPRSPPSVQFMLVKVPLPERNDISNNVCDCNRLRRIYMWSALYADVGKIEQKLEHHEEVKREKRRICKNTYNIFENIGDERMTSRIITFERWWLFEVIRPERTQADVRHARLMKIFCREEHLDF